MWETINGLRFFLCLDLNGFWTGYFSMMSTVVGVNQQACLLIANFGLPKFFTSTELYGKGYHSSYLLASTMFFIAAMVGSSKSEENVVHIKGMYRKVFFSCHSFSFFLNGNFQFHISQQIIHFDHRKPWGAGREEKSVCSFHSNSVYFLLFFGWLPLFTVIFYFVFFMSVMLVLCFVGIL